MKLLGWVHQKLCQMGRDQSMTFTVSEYPAGSYSATTLFDEQLFHSETTHSFTRPRQPNKKCSEILNITKEIRIDKVHEEYSHEEFFHGILAIGTLGSESIDKDPPTFPMSFQNSNDKKVITEDEVKLINKEIERFLSAEAKEVNDESLRRSSQVTVISFSNKQIKDERSDGGYSTEYPLQKYFFGDSIELPVAGIGSKKEKVSLEQLFNMSDRDPENSVKKYKSTEKTHTKSYAACLMKNSLKRVHSTAMSCTTGSTACNEQATKSGAMKRKIPKVLHPKYFHRKIHPEELIAEKQLTMAKKEKITNVSGKANISNVEDQEKNGSPEIGIIKKEIFNSTQYSQIMHNQGTMLNRERWIRTDDDSKQTDRSMFFSATTDSEIILCITLIVLLFICDADLVLEL